MFRGNSPKTSWQRVFGGQVIGQAMVAACRTVEGRLPHSLHCYFILPGDPQNSDHLPGRAAARRQELFDPQGHRDPARQRHLLDHGVVSRRRGKRLRPSGQDARRAAAGKTHSGGGGKAADLPRDAGIHPPLLRIRPPDRAAPGRAQPLFRREDRGRPHPCLDPHRLKTVRRSGAAHVRAGLCVGFLAAGCRDGALWPHAVRQAHDAGEPRSRDVVSSAFSAPTNGCFTRRIRRARRAVAA